MTRSDRGFTLVELLVASCITLLVTAALVGAARPSRSLFEAQSEAADQLQRGRVAAHALFNDLLMAGAGPDRGPDAGPLVRVVAPILPLGHARDDGDLAGSFRRDAITVAYVPVSRAETTIASELPARSGAVRVNTGAGCPLTDEACGFSLAATAIAYDDTGSLDVFRVEEVSGSLVQLRHTSVDSLKVYAPGSRLAEAVVRSYFLKADAVADTVQLMRDDHDGRPVAPVADHVVGLAFEYFGHPSDGPAPLAPSILTDGPWRPGENAPNRFDVDLLRVRTVAVRLRIESASAALRGPAGVLFSRAGTARSGNRFLPDLEFSFRVSPKNMEVAP